MKKSLIFAFAAVAVLASCNNGGQKIRTVADYQAYCNEFNNEFQQGYIEIQSDSTLTEDQKNEKANSFYESKLEEITKTSIDIIKAHPSDSLALFVYRYISSTLEDDQNAEVLKLFKGAIAESDYVLSQKAFQEAVEKTKEGNPFVDFTVVQDSTDVKASTVNFSDYIGKGKFVLVDFWASWCGPCRMLAPTVAEIAEEYEGRIKVGKVNVDDETDIAENYGIMSIPTLILFKNGSPVASSVGFVPKEKIEALIEG